MASTFSYTNPYATRKPSTPKTTDDFLEQLETTVSPNSLQEVLQQAQTQLSSLEWNLSSAIRFVDWVLQILEKESARDHDERNKSLLIAILGLLARCFDTWDDRIVYAAAVHQDNENSQEQTLLEHLEVLCLSDSKRNKQEDPPSEENPTLLCVAALTALTSVWEALDRLRHITTCLPLDSSRDSVWWIPTTQNSQEWQNVILFVLSSCGVQADRVSSQHQPLCASATSQLSQPAGSPRPEEWKATCASLLVRLLQHEQMDWIYLCSDQALDDFTQVLAKEASRLLDPNMPASSYTKLSLVSLNLWVALCQARGVPLDDEFRLQDLMDPVITAAFAPLSSSSSSTFHQDSRFRWTQVHQTSFPISQWSRDVLLAFCQSSIASIEEVVASNTCVRQSAEMAWTALTQTQSVQEIPSEQVAVHLLVLHRAFRSIARESLQRLLGTAGGAGLLCQQIPVNLLKMIRARDSMYAAGLLVALLSDRCKRVQHDDISRKMWKAVDDRFVSQCMELTLSRKSHSAASDYHGAKIVCLMDSLRVILTMEARLCGPTLLSLPAESVESLVNTMCPKTIRMETTGTGYDDENSQLGCSEESTPPVHNLSRVMVDTSICVEEDQRPRGMDQTIRIAAASVLATLGTSSQGLGDQIEEGCPLVLQQRMCESVQSFISDNSFYMITQLAGNNSSLEMARRRLHLLAAFSNPEHEELLSLSLHTAENSQRQAAHGILHKLDRCGNELKESRKREQQLRLEKEACERRLNQQSLRTQRERNELQRKLTFESKTQIALHWEERSKAEKRATELSVRLEEAERQATQAQAELESRRAAEAQARVQVEESNRKLVELQSRERDLRGRVESSEMSLSRVSAELETTRAAYNRVSSNEKELVARLEQQSAAAAAAEDSEDVLRESLESLFADMVSLARLYEIKEKEVSSSEENGAQVVEELQSKLKAEKARNSELLGQFEQVKYENEVLSQRVAKTREKLEKERKERQRDTVLRKRATSTSYINQLDISTTRTSSKSKRGAHYKGKENESSSSSYRSSSRSQQSSSYR